MPFILKDPKLHPAEDFHFLRKKGLEFIEQLGRNSWTDYNAHDPGITILEALSYAITELGYRTGWNIKDLLMQSGSDPYPDQLFYSARQILSCNPLTITDYRKILIDLPGIRNAWLVCKDCPCEVELYADCEAGQLTYVSPPSPKKHLPVIPLGAYDVMLELDQDPAIGDLNDRKILYSFSLTLAIPGQVARLEKVLIEARMPEWNTAMNGKFYDHDTNNQLVFHFPWKDIVSITLQKFVRSKSAIAATEFITDTELHTKWNDVFYTTMEVQFDAATGVAPVRLENVALRFSAGEQMRRMILRTDIEKELTLTTISGIVAQYFQKEERVIRAIEDAYTALMQQRNLCEDFCCISRVEVEDVAVCADIELLPDADIELVLANVLLAIELYLNPPIPFYSLTELRSEGVPTEEIFEGPKLKHGFLKTSDVQAAGLKTGLRTSDIINQLMEIEGVVAVKNLMLSKYDSEGQLIRGAADHGDPSQGSARWTLQVSDRHQPRLYAMLSKILFLKNGLPFLAHLDEVQDTLLMLRSRIDRPKIHAAEMDLEIPKGNLRDSYFYSPVKDTLPLTYGVSPAGLSDRALPLRHAQAKQLKGYLLFFEQILANHFAQLLNVRELFSISSTKKQSYYQDTLRNNAIFSEGEDLITADLDEDKLLRLIESPTDYLGRRNQFLDHLLARFGESFSGYVLALHNWHQYEQHAIDQEKLIDDKIAFLKDYTVISGERFRGINYRHAAVTQQFPGLRQRFARLLGFDQVMEEKIILVEHFLLRPKFFGDALMEVCLDNNCTGCSDEDPYSFQMTCVMPGWLEPFNHQLEMRTFADHTLRMETPAHIILKTCWVGNEGYIFNPCHPSVSLLAEWITLHTVTASNERPNFDQACACTTKLFQLYDIPFQTWIQTRLSEHQLPDQVKTILRAEFESAITAASLSSIAGCDLDLSSSINNIHGFMAAHFTGIAVNGFQYDKFVKAWNAWLEENRHFNWCEVNVETQLQYQLAHIFEARELPGPSTDCACKLMARFGQQFLKQQQLLSESNADIPSGDQAKDLISTIFDDAFADGITCDNVSLTASEIESVRSLFTQQYVDFFDVSHKLHLVIDLLGKLNSVYPPATLHDCDEGSDVNPVRLGNTRLGG